ncbi:MAG: hypothetical protein ABIQ21_13510 [Chryseolinea sp.]
MMVNRGLNRNSGHHSNHQWLQFTGNGEHHQYTEQLFNALEWNDK